MDLTAHPAEAAWKFAAAVVFVCAALQAVALADRSQSQPRNRDIRRYVLGEIYDQHRVEQQFVVKAQGLSSLTIHPRPASPSPTGTVTLTLRDITRGSDGPVVHRLSEPLAALAQRDALALQFAPQPSQNRSYALDIAVHGGSDGQGIGLLASRGDGDRRASLLVNGRRQWGNLVFETTVDGAPSNFGAIAGQLGRGGVPAPRAALMAVLILADAMLFLLLQAFSRWPEPAVAPALPHRTLPSL